MFPVALNVAVKFLVPIIHICLRPPAVTTGMPMPKTAVNKNRDLVFWQNDVGLTRKVLAMQAKPVAEAMQRLAHS
jgi:hypothetical protein